MGKLKRMEKMKAKLRQNRKMSKKNKKRARIVIKNLPFATTEESLREHFKPYGEIKEITILKKEDGRLVGCAFIEYELVQQSVKAIHYTNEKPFLNRNIIVERAKPKSKYQKEKQTETVKIKEEPLDKYDANITIKKEIDDELDLSIVKKEEINEDEENLTFEIVKDAGHEKVNQENLENKSQNEGDNESEQESNTSDSEDSENNDDSSSDGSNGDNQDYSDKNYENKDDEEESKNISKSKFISNDASEGKTVFIKNVPFHATNKDLAKCMSQFGPFYYALICIDRLTEHSKGTAFVKFKNKEDAEKCLDEKDLTLLGNVLDCQRALTRNDLEQKVKDKNDKKSKQSDSRNLYLVKEGVILAGTKAADGVSESDMAKRLQLEQYKTQMLRNLNMFVSKTRLVVHNLPLTWDDKKLRALCIKHAGPKALIKESRVMRDMRNVDANGVGKSKGFGFVSFNTHEDALNVLRSLNNNPDVFTPSKRPVVTFSIENRSKILAKEKRYLNSRFKNPNSKDYNPNLVKKQEKLSEIAGKKRKTNSEEKKGEDNDNTGDFAGIVAKPGDLGFKKMRSTFHLKTQAKLHHQNVKQQNKLRKNVQKPLLEKKKEFTKQRGQKVNKNKEKNSDSFSKMVNEYKKKLMSTSGGDIIKKNKWYNNSI